jgi:hypothetical protein
MNLPTTPGALDMNVRKHGGIKQYADELLYNMCARNALVEIMAFTVGSIY